MSGITEFLKKDISFKRKPASTKPKTKAKTAKAAPPKEEKPSTKAPKAARKPKRELSLPKRDLSLPKRAPKPRKAASPSSAGRHKQLVGLSIGASQLSAAVVVNNGRPKLVKAARRALPADVVVGGEVRDSEALANEIATFFSEADLPRKNVRLGIGSSRTGVRVFERPDVADPRQLANAIRFRAYETLPIPIEEAMLDYHVVEETNAPDRVLLAVAYRDLVDRYAATCAAAKIELVGIDIEAFALLRAVGGEPLKAGERAEAARVAVSIGHDRTTVAVSDGRVCEFTRVLDWGGARVTAAVQRALDVDADEAERVKRTLDISAAATDAADERTTRAVEAARREVHGLARELASSLHFYQDQPDSLGFAEITITGGGAHLQGLAEQLEELIGISVRVADPFARVGSGHGISSNGQDGALAVAIGLGIED
ncbi:MAG TPA: type IV pilus assembly protein PilM [Gaiellaceae bacterium]|nr:type IV pilus assembly protein PilM [Gaiellaceae bacterium]